MASVKLPWTRVRAVLWRAIPEPLTDGRLLLVLDDSINPKTVRGSRIRSCNARGARSARDRLREAARSHGLFKGLVFFYKWRRESPHISYLIRPFFVQIRI